MVNDGHNLVNVIYERPLIARVSGEFGNQWIKNNLSEKSGYAYIEHQYVLIQLRTFRTHTI